MCLFGFVFFFFYLSLAGRVDEPQEPKYRHLCEVDLSAYVNVYLHEYGVKDSDKAIVSVNGTSSCSETIFF